jgi:hypothetical protein
VTWGMCCFLGFGGWGGESESFRVEIVGWGVSGYGKRSVVALETGSLVGKIKKVVEK